MRFFIGVKSKKFKQILAQIGELLKVAEQLQTQQAINQAQIMSALETLTQTVTDLNTAVANNLVPAANLIIQDYAKQNPTEAQLTSLNTSVAGLLTTVNAVAQQINDTVNPPAPAPAPAPATPVNS